MIKKVGSAFSALVLGLVTTGGAQGSETSKREVAQLEISRKADQQTAVGSSDHFTGTATFTGHFQRPQPSRVAGALVRFEPGARTVWHTHPLGQTLIITEGIGWAQVEGGSVIEVRPGDVVWCPPGRKHWHGATSKTAVAHIAIQESLNGSTVTWLEKVTDAQYLPGSSEIRN